VTAADRDFRWTAVLSADMVDFTATARRIGAERSFELLNHLIARASAAIEEEEGQVVDTAGDGILASFGAPKAVENAALRCCRAAQVLRERLSAERDMLAARFDVAPELRIGLAGGHALVARSGPQDFKLVGDAVQEAARLQSLCAPGEVLMSDALARETTGFVRVSDRGLIEIKGFEDPVRALRLEGLIQTATQFEGRLVRGLGPMVSREAELGRAQVALDAGGKTVLVSGQPGVGKSRLVHEIVSRRVGQKVLIGQCAPSGRTLAYAPILDILRKAGGARWGANRAETIAALASRYPNVIDREKAAQFLQPMSQSRDQGDRALADRAFLLSVMRGLAIQENCILGLEDVHWVDASTQMLVSAAVEAKLPMLMTSRPVAKADWMDRPEVVQVELGPLGRDAIRSIAEGCLDTTISPDLAAMISDKAEGIPLVAEEIVRALDEGEKLARGPDGMALVVTGDVLLTGNLEQLVLSRVDRIAPEQKSVLQVASAIGRDFSSRLLEAALGERVALHDLAASGLIQPLDGGVWRFSHALVRDAVYASLLSDKRHDAHERIAAGLQSMAAHTDGQDGLLADHLLMTKQPERAVPHLIAAAMESLAAYALYDVDQRLEQAMGFLDADPTLANETAFGELGVSWLRALDQIGDFGRVLRVSERVLPRLSRNGYSAQLAIVRTLTAIAMTHARNYRSSEELALATLDAAEAEGDDLGTAWAKVALMRIYDETGWKDYTTLERLAHEILPVAEAAGDQHLAMTALYLLSAGYRSAGFRLKALDVASQIEAFSDTHNNKRAIGYAIWARSVIHCVEGNPELARAAVAPAVKAAVPGQADERVSLGIDLFAQVYLAPPEEVRPKLARIIAESRTLEDFNIAHSMEWNLALLEIKSGRLALGWRKLMDLEQEVLRAGNTNLIRQVLVAKAEVLLAVAGLIDPDAEAPPDRPTFPKARLGLADIFLAISLRLRAKRLAIRVIQSCLSYETAHHGAHFSRCEIGLGLIAASRGRRDEARTHLERGLQSARAEELDVLARRAERALENL